VNQDDWQGISAVGIAGGAVVGFLSWIAGRRGRRAEMHRALAEARKFELETAEARTGSAADFEKVVNERASFAVEMQARVMTQQQQHIADLTAEIQSLKQVIAYLQDCLAETSRKLERVQSELDVIRNRDAA
jgi:predicted RNase H-like nuclease (RuvC/YqgF family)